MSLEHEIVSAFPSQRIVVLGDVMLDRFVFGDVQRVSPEAPIPIFRFGHDDHVLGGAGNVARNVARMGGQATLIGVIGKDVTGRALAAAATREAGLTPSLATDARRRTTLKTRFVAQGQQLLRVDEEAAEPLAPDISQDLRQRIEIAADGANAIVLSDYAKGVLTEDSIASALSAARRRGAIVVVDPKGRDFRRYAGATVITPNASEAAQASGIDCDSDESASRASRAIADITGCSAVVITRGARGMTVLCEAQGSGRMVHLPTEVRQVYDVSGAGDTVVAALALALASGAPIDKAAQIANLAAGIAVGKVGTAAVEAAELRRAINASAVLAHDEKIVGLETAVSIARSWRLHDKRVVLTNGCFDLLHPGHIGLLQKAKALGDKLIVAINSDESIKRLKGPSRPVQNEAARAVVMASIAPVDLVVIFAEDTPIEVIEAIRPDVLVKGADYELDQVAGRDIVEAYGGRVALVPLEKGHSTTDAIRKAAAASVETR
ncbi:MAG: D-glycero-beta-D-manno-heptose-7-phosphate kinase [Hyphomicrobiales bacterium]|nr:D-glycero-beta-D-manno-heptose-7-phosphate kinase [Hyphomicrobiales bacterium]MBV9518208.1 D-glycero-beta-D-manno-heptose-7-phosphate kinase [Hyphomicrobiales bacterium]